MTLKLNMKKYSEFFFLIMVFSSIVFAFYTLKSYFFIFMTAGILSVVSYPLYIKILKFKIIKNNRNFASAFTCVLIVLLIVIPLTYIAFQVSSQSVDVYKGISEKLQDSGFVKSNLDKLIIWQKKYLPRFNFETIDIQKNLISLGQNISHILVSNIASLLSNIAATFFKFFLMLFIVFYLLKEGTTFLKWLEHISPLPSSYEKKIFNKFKDVSESAFFGSFLTAFIQGLLGGIGFAIVGLPAFFWGVAMAFLSLIPLIGTAVIWCPAAIFLLISKSISYHLLKGIFLMLWGIGIVGAVDNILRPYFMKDKMSLHPALIFFAILGGIKTFGLLGIVLGPLSLAICLVLLDVYSKEAREELEKLDQL